MAGVDQTQGVTSGAAPRISVVVPTVDRVELLARTLRGLAAQHDAEFEAIVVHDGDPAVVALLDEWQGRLPLRAIRIAERGTVAKRNAGWRAARASVVAFTDDDCEPAPGWLTAALDAFEKDPQIDLVQGRVDPHPEDAAVGGIFKRTVTVQSHYEGYPNANLVYRRTALERVGGYDDAYWGAGEDADLAFRVLESGGSVAYVDNALVWHAVRPVGFVEHLRSLPRWANAPLTMKRHAQLRPLVHHRIFWKPSHTTGVVALAGLVLLPFTWRGLALIAPHVVRRVRGNGVRDGAQLAAADVAEVAVTVAGAIRYRTLFI
jgi:cellulose synthase/poly-beta-1,6-N-acetylglucosamine synthase-like glycosyltransferase